MFVGEGIGEDAGSRRVEEGGWMYEFGHLRGCELRH